MKTSDRFLFFKCHCFSRSLSITHNRLRSLMDRHPPLWPQQLYPHPSRLLAIRPSHRPALLNRRANRCRRCIRAKRRLQLTPRLTGITSTFVPSAQLPPSRMFTWVWVAPFRATYPTAPVRRFDHSIYTEASIFIV